MGVDNTNKPFVLRLVCRRHLGRLTIIALYTVDLRLTHFHGGRAQSDNNRLTRVSK